MELVCNETHNYGNFKFLCKLNIRNTNDRNTRVIASEKEIIEIGKQIECFSIAKVDQIDDSLLNVFILVSIGVEVGRIGGIDDMDDVFIR